MKAGIFKWLLGALVLLALVAGIAGCSSGADKKAASDADEVIEAEASEAPITTETTVAQAPPAAQPAAGKRPHAVVETNKGKIVFELYPHKAPKTVANFVSLAGQSFYNGIKWHRVEPGFVIQGGDPLSKDDDPANDGLGGPGYKIDAEFNDVPHITGTVAMARAQDPNSAGSQFYICLDAQPSLDGNYTVFGQVVEGMDVVERIQVGDLMSRVYIEER
ncbi:MAG: peptidylprolyl isomerase [Actinobacteria bacterium]|nr:peptidylprolyl isomerase [Actinomycetota bacterium]